MSDAIRESEILTPRDPSLDTNTDDWPEFVLSNVHVHLPDDHSATRSLLEAGAEHPLTVTGQLEPLDDDDAHLYRRLPGKTRPTLILEEVRMFSYGQYSDRTTAIWAAGKAGWFMIKPGRGYKSTFNDMAAAVNALYFIVDCFREPRTKVKGKNVTILPNYTLQELFEKYAAEELGSSDPEDGAQSIYKHKEFLISSMLGGKEGLAWSKNPLYKHLHIKYPDLFAKLRQRLAVAVPHKAEGKPETGKPRPSRQAAVEVTQSTTSSQRKSGRPAKRVSRPVDVIPLDGSSDLSPTGREPSLQVASENSASHSKPTATTRSKAKSTRQARQNSVATSIPEEPWRGEVTIPVIDEETDEEMKLYARKNKSSLRPRASKGSKSMARKSSKRQATEEREETDGDGDEAEPTSSPTSSKRKFEPSAELRRPSKRNSSKPHLDEGIDIPSSPSASGDADNATSPVDSTGAPPGDISDTSLRTFAHVPDPVQEDTWVCALDGCTHKVYAASNLDSQRLIREHYALHAYDDDERVQMVKKLQAPSLPAGHLMERVKLQAKMEGFPGSRQMASRYPVTIPGVKQRY